jgi:hypothetical protein
MQGKVAAYGDPSLCAQRLSRTFFHLSARVSASIIYEILSRVKYIIPPITIGPVRSGDTAHVRSFDLGQRREPVASERAVDVRPIAMCRTR